MPNVPPSSDLYREIIDRITHRFVASGETVGNYPLEMTLQALCELHALLPDAGWGLVVEDVWRRRGWSWDYEIPYVLQPFAAHNGAFSRIHQTAPKVIADVYVRQTAEMLAKEPLDPRRRITHWSPRLPRDGRHPLLIDFMSGYAARLSEAAAMGGDLGWFDFAAYQFEEYAKVLSDPASGLWRLGRGWGEAPDGLCEGAWSRGHGWLLRGLADTLRWMPRDHPRREALVDILLSVAEALKRIQLPDGRWPVLLHLPPSESAPETSGTALIGYGLARALANGDIDRDSWQEMTLRAINAACGQVDEQGMVHGACRGPGTLFPEGVSLYLHKEIAPDDPHGRPCVLYAAIGGILLAQKS